MEGTCTETEKKFGVQGLLSWRYKIGVITIELLELMAILNSGEFLFC